ncbi:MAG: hypothetical protein V4510_11310 [bacterium]
MRSIGLASALVALLVGLAAALAGCGGTTIVVVTGTPSETTAPHGPRLSFNREADPAGGGTVTVVRADPGIAWSSIEVATNGAEPAPIGWEQGAAKCSTSTVEGDVQAGDVIRCGASVTRMAISIAGPSGAVRAYETTFP